jgi:hypothetical protein
MARFLYFFTYQTPGQSEAARTGGAVEEASAALFIEAETAEAALAWGREISGALFHHLTGAAAARWTSLNFAHWIESHPELEYPPEILAALPCVACGQLPDFDRLMA